MDARRKYFRPHHPCISGVVHFSKKFRSYPISALPLIIMFAVIWRQCLSERYVCWPSPPDPFPAGALSFTIPSTYIISESGCWIDWWNFGPWFRGWHLYRGSWDSQISRTWLLLHLHVIFATQLQNVQMTYSYRRGFFTKKFRSYSVSALPLIIIASAVIWRQCLSERMFVEHRLVYKHH